MSASNDKNTNAGSIPWYERNPARFQAEIDSMRQVAPYAEQLLLDDGRVCWVARTNLPAPAATDGRRDWEFLIVYDEHRIEAPVTTLCYPLSPNEEKMRSLLEETGRPDHIPHAIRDENMNIVLSTETGCESVPRDGIQSAALRLRGALRWAMCFELSLIDDGMWEDFTGMSLTRASTS